MARTLLLLAKIKFPTHQQPRAATRPRPVIYYIYDPRYRLTRAEYDDGSYFEYTLRLHQGRLFDASVNRLMEVD